MFNVFWHHKISCLQYFYIIKNTVYSILTTQNIMFTVFSTSYKCYFYSIFASQNIIFTIFLRHKKYCVQYFDNAKYHVYSIFYIL